MKNGIARFDYYLNQVQGLLDTAAKQKNPGLWLYQNNLRTPLFMLEALAKLYAGIHNPKRFTKLKAHFKLLEDILGAIDYYDAFAKQFAANKKIPASITTYLQAQTREKVQSLNEILTEKGWLGEGNRRIIKIRKKLNGAGWLPEEKEIKAIEAFYHTAIAEILAFVKERKYHFQNVEADVHELRRKLRWLSIYPQAFRGCIQLTPVKPVPAHLKKYLTPAITGSPFNKMPDAANNRYFLLLNQQYFLALSWMIAELGSLKDSGLAVVAVKEALQQTASLTEAAALKQAYSILGNKQPSIRIILDKADALCKKYFAEKNLSQLVKAVAAAKQT